MISRVSKVVAGLAFVCGSALWGANLLADDVANKVVIQVSTDDERTQKIALNNAVNIQKSLGADEVKIEIVAYGPGLGIMTLAGKQSQRVADLALQDITFSACNNTIKKITKKKGAVPKLVEGVTIVGSGAVRIIELQQQGYAYIRP
jgi:intracellular sulfur oxidation DsrE/DsrF family protein